MNNSKTILSRLLSKENISVEVGNFHTASFDLLNRTLNIPDWGISNKRVLDHLIGHEISHALNTSLEMWEAPQKKHGARVKGIVNVIEDIRIERLVLKLYPGLKRDFRESYNVLVNEMDLFQTKGEDVNAMSFINRLNLYAKGGIYGLYDISFNAEEKAFADKCLKAETEDDVLGLVDEFVANWGTANEEPEGEEEGEGQEGEGQEGEESGEGGEATEQETPEGDESGEGDDFDCSTQDNFDSFEGGDGDAGEASNKKPQYNEDAFDCSTQDAFDKGLEETISGKVITKIPSRKITRNAIRRLKDRKK